MLIGCCLISHLLVLDPPAADHGEQHRLELLAAPAVDDDVDAAVDDHQVPAENDQSSVTTDAELMPYIGTKYLLIKSMFICHSGTWYFPWSAKHSLITLYLGHTSRLFWLEGWENRK